MNLARIKSFSWTDKPEIKKSSVYIGGFVIALLFAVVRLRPYFEASDLIVPFVKEKDVGREKGGANKVVDSKKESSQSREINAQSRNAGAGSRSASSGENRMSHVIERPLFDGLLVKLKAVLRQGISSGHDEPIIEAELVDDDDLPASFDRSLLKSARLMGTATPNFETKRYQIQFNEMITNVGKSYAIIGYAFDEEAQAVGVAANYSSGMGYRVAGDVLGRGIQVGEDILTTRAFQSTGNESAATAEINRAAMNSSQSATGDISQEVTKDLRGKKPELSLPAGTVFTLKLRAQNQKAGGR